MCYLTRNITENEVRTAETGAHDSKEDDIDHEHNRHQSQASGAELTGLREVSNLMGKVQPRLCGQNGEICPFAYTRIVDVNVQA